MSNFKVNENVDVLPTDPSGSESQGRNVLPKVGYIMLFAGATAPSGWLLCNGQSTSGHPNLAAIVGATVPNLVGRYLVGVYSSNNIGHVSGSNSHSHFGFFYSGVNATNRWQAHDHSFNTFNTDTVGIAHNHTGNLNQSFANSLGTAPHTNFVNGTQANVITRNHIHPTTGTPNLAYTSTGTHNHRHDAGASNSSGMVSNSHNHFAHEGLGLFSSGGSHTPPTISLNYIIKADF
jgi:microcystin-dependent protein